MRFEYKARKMSGETVEGVLEADNRRLVISRLQSMNLYPIKVEEKAKRGLAQELTVKSFKRISHNDITTFTRQISDLVKAGLPLVRALSVLEKQTPNEKFLHIVSQMRSDVQTGLAFSDALAKHPKVFPPLYSNMVRAGELGGMLDQVMQRLAAFQANDQEMRSKIMAAMFYPAIMLLLGTGVVTVLITVVIPNFITMYEEFGQDLPAITQSLVLISSILTGFWYVIVAFIGLIIFAYKRMMSTKEGRLRRDGFLLRVPVLGDLLLKREVAKFGRTLGTLLQNGVPILKALEITETVASNVVIARIINKVRSNIREGERLSDHLGAGGIFPPVAVNMVAVGEETGRLEDTLEHVAESYEAETDRVLKVLTALLEPLMIVVMGVVVGYIVVAMVVPIFRLTQTLG
jgi:type IV pilus assembly protein PilC